MAMLTHPSMSKGAPVNPAPKETKQPEPYVVEDLSQFERPAEEPKQETVVFQTALKKTLNEGERKQLDDLIFLGRVNKEVEIAGHKFELSTLTHKEHTGLMRELAKVSDTANLFIIRVYTLACSIKKIDGVGIDDLKTEGEFDSTFDRRVDIIDNMQLRVIERLFEEYGTLSDESDKLVTGETIKKS